MHQAGDLADTEVVVNGEWTFVCAAQATSNGTFQPLVLRRPHQRAEGFTVLPHAAPRRTPREALLAAVSQAREHAAPSPRAKAFSAAGRPKGPEDPNAVLPTDTMQGRHCRRI